MSGNGASQSKTDSYTFDDKDNMSRFDAGLTFGVGASYGKFYLGLGYDLGLANMYTGDGDVSVKNGSFGISLGYNF
jgi:hypothetical protein